MSLYVREHFVFYNEKLSVLLSFFSVKEKVACLAFHKAKEYGQSDQETLSTNFFYFSQSNHILNQSIKNLSIKLKHT